MWPCRNAGVALSPRDFAITEIDFSNEVSDPDDRSNRARVRPADVALSATGDEPVLRNSEKLGYTVGSDGPDGAPRDLSASSVPDMSAVNGI